MLLRIVSRKWRVKLAVAMQMQDASVPPKGGVDEGAQAAGKGPARYTNPGPGLYTTATFGDDGGSVAAQGSRAEPPRFG